MQVTISAASMRCGWLDTGDTLSGGPVRLRFVVLRARPDRVDPQPVIHVPGGPGDSAGLKAAALVRWRRWQQSAGWPHDIILYDPRGTGESRPRPDCAHASTTPLRASRTSPQDHDLSADAANAARCRRALGDATAAALGPDAQLRDLLGLMDGLGIARAHIWAVSYGTRLARLFEDRHPARVASLVLDSMVPFGESEITALPLQLRGAIDQLASFCQSTPCASSAPRRAIATLLARYDRSPPTIRLGVRPSAQRRFTITPYRLLLMILLAGYEPGHSADTVQRLERAVRGDVNALAPLAQRLQAQAEDPGRSEPVFYSTRCALQPHSDEASWQTALASAPLVAPYIKSARHASVCARWPVPRMATVDEGTPLSSPVLIVTGRQDRATPPVWSDAYEAAHPGAIRVDVPGAAHVPTLADVCAQRAVAAFLNRPGVAPRLACLDD